MCLIFCPRPLDDQRNKTERPVLNQEKKFLFLESFLVPITKNQDV